MTLKIFPKAACDPEIVPKDGHECKLEKIEKGKDGTEICALQIILDLCIPEKELAKTRSPISFK
jgi:hypothetical protein